MNKQVTLEKDGVKFTFDLNVDNQGKVINAMERTSEVFNSEKFRSYLDFRSSVGDHNTNMTDLEIIRLSNEIKHQLINSPLRNWIAKEAINILPKVFYKMKYDKKVLDFKFIIVNKKGVVLNTISRESFEKFKKDNPKTLLTKVR